MTAFDATRAEHYDHLAHQWAAYQAFHQTAVAALDAHLPECATVALVGVGTGNEAKLLRERRPRWRLVGLDPAPAMLEVARRKLGDTVELREGTLQEHPDLNELDGVSLIGVLHHLPTTDAQDELLQTIRQRLKPGGLLVFGCQVGPYVPGSLREATLARSWGVPPHEAQQRMGEFRAHTLPLDPEGLQRTLRAAGFARWERLLTAIYFEIWVAVVP